jgi:hypothetical protein
MMSKNNIVNFVILELQSKNIPIKNIDLLERDILKFIDRHTHVSHYN